MNIKIYDLRCLTLLLTLCGCTTRLPDSIPDPNPPPEVAQTSAVDLDPAHAVAATMTLKQAQSKAQPAVVVLPPPIPNVRIAPASLTVSWPGSDGAAGYNVYYGPSSGNYVGLASCMTTRMVLNGLVGLTDYYVAVTAVDTNGVESDFSGETEAQTEEVLDVKFTFKQAVTNVVPQFSPDLAVWGDSFGTPNTNGTWRIHLPPGVTGQTFYFRARATVL